MQEEPLKDIIQTLQSAKELNDDVMEYLAEKDKEDIDDEEIVLMAASIKFNKAQDKLKATVKGG